MHGASSPFRAQVAFYLKAGERNLLFGLLAAVDFATAHHLWWLLLPASIGLVWKPRADARVAQVAALACVTAAWGVIGAEGKPFHRYLAPALPFVYVLVGCGFERLAPGLLAAVASRGRARAGAARLDGRAIGTNRLATLGRFLALNYPEGAPLRSTRWGRPPGMRGGTSR